jgi:hypothetical protein
MKKYWAFILFVISIGILGCSKDRFSGDEREFMSIYKQILLARYTIEDSVRANKKVTQILKDNGYNFQSFLKLFWELKNKDPKKFAEMMDTIKKQALNEVLEAKKKELAQPPKR